MVVAAPAEGEGASGGDGFDPNIPGENEPSAWADLPPLAVAIRRLHQHYGSHDKLAHKLADLAPNMRPGRQVIINWEKGAVPDPGYRAALIQLGVDPTLFPEPERPKGRLLRLETEIRTHTAELRLAQETIRRLSRRVAALEKKIEASQSGPEAQANH